MKTEPAVCVLSAREWGRNRARRHAVCIVDRRILRELERDRPATLSIEAVGMLEHVRLGDALNEGSAYPKGPLRRIEGPGVQHRDRATGGRRTRSAVAARRAQDRDGAAGARKSAGVSALAAGGRAVDAPHRARHPLRGDLSGVCAFGRRAKDRRSEVRRPVSAALGNGGGHRHPAGVSPGRVMRPHVRRWPSPSAGVHVRFPASVPIGCPGRGKPVTEVATGPVHEGKTTWTAGMRMCPDRRLRAPGGGGGDVRVAGKRRCHLPTDSARHPTNLHSRNPMIIP